MRIHTKIKELPTHGIENFTRISLGSLLSSYLVSFVIADERNEKLNIVETEIGARVGSFLVTQECESFTPPGRGSEIPKIHPRVENRYRRSGWTDLLLDVESIHSEKRDEEKFHASSVSSSAVKVNKR